MKRRRAGSYTTGEEAPEACASEAKEAVRIGVEHPLGNYIRELGEVLSHLANVLQQNGKIEFERDNDSARQPKEFTSRPDDHAEPIEEIEDWEGTRDQIEKALRAGNAELISSYLRDAADVLNRVASSLAPPQRSRGWRLEFIRSGRGRRHDPTSMSIKSKRAMELRLAARAAGKQEAAVEELKGKPGRSRASLFRAKKLSKISESHKKQ